MLIHDIKKAFNFTYLHVTSRTAPKQDRDDRKRSLEKCAKPMIHPRSYETCDKKAERKAKVE